MTTVDLTALYDAAEDGEADALDAVLKRAGLLWDCYGTDPDAMWAHWTNPAENAVCDNCGLPRNIGEVYPPNREPGWQDRDQERIFTLETEVTYDEAVAILLPEVKAECATNADASDVHTLGDVMADVVSRFERALAGEQEALGGGPVTFTLPAIPREVIVLSPGELGDATSNAFHLSCPYCNALDRVQAVEDAGEVNLSMRSVFVTDTGELVVDFSTDPSHQDGPEWQDKHECRACNRQVVMPEYQPSYDGGGF